MIELRSLSKKECNPSIAYDFTDGAKIKNFKQEYDKAIALPCMPSEQFQLMRWLL